MNIMNNRYEKEAFVQGLSGSSVGEVLVMTTLPSMLVLLCCLVKRKWEFGILGGMVLEYVILVVPEIAQVSGWDPRVVLGLACSVTVAVFLFGGGLFCGGMEGSNRCVDKDEPPSSSLLYVEMKTRMRDAVSVHRGNVMLLTCLSILAVDFHVFPRKYGKVETYGTSFMDAGVGSIVFCSAFVQGIKASTTTTYDGTRGPTGEKTKRHDVYRLLALAVLGLGRPIVTSMIGYQNHVGEYGVHWNFFLTLFVIRLIILVVPESWDPFWLGTVLLCTHQLVLSGLGMNGFVNDEQHRLATSIVSQNKEGLVSMVGYLCLHWLGEWSAKVCARIIYGRNRRVCLVKQALFICILWTGHIVCSKYIETTSRRSCNAAFVLWMLANNVQAVCLNTVILSLVVEAKYSNNSVVVGGKGDNNNKKSKTPLSRAIIPDALACINRSMLGVFLVANVLTGAVNMVFDTLAVSDTQARSILAIYMAVLLSVAMLLAKK
eukprot:jgi/Picsp_1/5588/NSC_02947-R1_gpi-anchored wall transfer protein 1